MKGRIGVTWLSLRNISGLLQNDACIRPVLLYGSETWASTQKLVETLVRNKNKMLKRLVGMKYSGKRSSFGGNMWYTMAGDQTKKSKTEVVKPYIEKAKTV